MSKLEQSLCTFRAALQSFASSTSSFQILRSIPSTTSHRPKALYVLDSSFNPPTRAHLQIATSAILDDEKAKAEPVKRLLLLLATQNADKAPKPASFEQRLTMMSTFAEDLVRSVQEQCGDERTESQTLVVDVGVIKTPLYLDKALVIDRSGEYGTPNAGPEQVHLTGFDSLIRLLDTKYYPPDHTLQPLETLFSRHRIRATRRIGDEWGGRERQDAFLQALADGESESQGARREWATRIDLVDGKSEGEESVSSTKVRDAAKRKDSEALAKLVPDGVRDWMLAQELYLNE